MRRVLEFIKKDPVLCASGMIACVSCFFVKPNLVYFTYIDYAVICILYSLMVVVSGLKNSGLFEKGINAFFKKVKSTRAVSAVLVFACFFSSMLITNDVALITFVPLSIMIFCSMKRQEFLIPVIVLETVAANLGSMLTPIGNPQNLYIYSLYELNAREFVMMMLPIALVSFFLVTAGVFFIKKEKVEVEERSVCIKNKKALLFGGLFVVCIMSVIHILPYYISLLIVLAVTALADKKLLMQADFALLFTFIFLFIFIGNVKNIPELSMFLEKIIDTKEMICAIALSQIISNVPAAMLLSGFTDNYRELLFGVNIGGLGTLIASMASLISYKLYAKCENADVKKYVFVFTLVNLVMLVLLWWIGGMI